MHDVVLSDSVSVEHARALGVSRHQPFLVDSKGCGLVRRRGVFRPGGRPRPRDFTSALATAAGAGACLGAHIHCHALATPSMRGAVCTFNHQAAAARPAAHAAAGLSRGRGFPVARGAIGHCSERAACCA